MTRINREMRFNIIQELSSQNAWESKASELPCQNPLWGRFHSHEKISRAWVHDPDVKEIIGRRGKENSDKQCILGRGGGAEEEELFSHFLFLFFFFFCVIIGCRWLN
ncbi:uncharacterized protein LOC122024976 isoform X2 [Zingiber officinale]|uniref:uncharacterized protein LOC122024976 isoform X2 n=1 Tax=Zingiber officinale TaxID=94328 RepID=UPI001C4CEBD4|nr:uncharacterized protein LOC122024976 isoform X2 [Zingiber officinale]